MSNNIGKLPTTTSYKVTKDTFYVNGLLFYSDNNNFYRLPNNQNFNEPLNWLQRHSSGAYISFTTNSSMIGVKVKLAGKSYMAHFSATGTIGLDLYGFISNKYVFIGTTKIDEAEFTYTYLKDISKTERNYRLYLPTYIEIIELEIIIDSASYIKQEEHFDLPKVICYGTSITQGGCATRGGMSYSSILGRALKDYEVFNLGFSGNANLQKEIANLISNIKNMEILIMEVEANAGATLVLEERLEDFITTILVKKPNLRIYLISHYPHPHVHYYLDLKLKIKKHKEFQKKICNKYSKNMTFIDGEKIFKNLNFEETVDTVHLTDLGFYNLAARLSKILKK